MKEPSNYPSSYNDPRHERRDIDFSQEDAGQQEPERIHEDYYPRDDYSSRPRQPYRPRPDRDDYRDDYREPTEAVLPHLPTCGNTADAMSTHLSVA